MTPLPSRTGPPCPALLPKSGNGSKALRDLLRIMARAHKHMPPRMPAEADTSLSALAGRCGAKSIPTTSYLRLIRQDR